jgi:hypothetical protein
MLNSVPDIQSEVSCNINAQPVVYFTSYLFSSNGGSSSSGSSSNNSSNNSSSRSSSDIGNISSYSLYEASALSLLLITLIR